jgi:hypothetical protein
MVVLSRHGCTARQFASRFTVTTSSMKVRKAVFQLKGSALLWWKTLLLLLNMEVEVGSWELFKEWFRERTTTYGSTRPTTVGDLDKDHQIHATVNNRQAEHRSTVLETSGTVADQTLSILLEPCATESFIFGAMLKRIKVNLVEHDEFSFVEMASGAKQKVGRKVTSYSLNLGEFVTRANLYVTILGSYDVVISMDWLESLEVILNCNMKWLSLVDDEG